MTDKMDYVNPYFPKMAENLVPLGPETRSKTQYIGFGQKKIVAFSPKSRRKIFSVSAAGGLDNGETCRNLPADRREVTDIYKKFTKL